MKKVLLVLALTGLVGLALGGPGTAADLKAGWYANLGSVYIYDYDGTGQPYIRATGRFSTSPGQYGPFLVTDGTTHSTSYRSISVPLDVSGVGPDKNLDLPIAFGMTIGDHIGFVDIGWTTNYDASQMYAQLWATNASGQVNCVWSQQLSEHQFGNTDVLQDAQFEGPFFFRVSVVPEPTSALGLLTVLSAGCAATLRRRRG